MQTASSSATLDAWRAQLWSTFVRLESTSDAKKFYGAVRTPIAGTTMLSNVRSTMQLTERTMSNIRSDPQEVLIVSYQKSGRGYIEQDGRQCALNPGEFAVYDSTKPYRLSFDGPFEQTVCRISRQRVADGLPQLERAIAQTMNGQSGAGMVFSSLLDQLCTHGARLSQYDLAAYEPSIAQMLATAMRLHDAGISDESAARLKLQILREIRDPDFDLTDLARRESMSPRTLQRLFQSEGQTPRGWIQAQRLAGVANDLRDATQDARSVTDIALSWGFNDLSLFCRAFRQRYDCSARKMAYRPGRLRP